MVRLAGDSSVAVAHPAMLAQQGRRQDGQRALGDEPCRSVGGEHAATADDRRRRGCERRRRGCERRRSATTSSTNGERRPGSGAAGRRFWSGCWGRPSVQRCSRGRHRPPPLAPAATLSQHRARWTESVATRGRRCGWRGGAGPFASAARGVLLEPLTACNHGDGRADATPGYGAGRLAVHMEHSRAAPGASLRCAGCPGQAPVVSLCWRPPVRTRGATGGHGPYGDAASAPAWPTQRQRRLREALHRELQLVAQHGVRALDLHRLQP